MLEARAVFFQYHHLDRQVVVLRREPDLRAALIGSVLLDEVHGGHAPERGFDLDAGADCVEVVVQLTAIGDRQFKKSEMKIALLNYQKYKLLGFHVQKYFLQISLLHHRK